MTTPLARLLAYQIEAGHYPGALVHVERAGQVVAHQAAGRLRPDSELPLHEGARFCIASLTKPVVTLAALMLVDEGQLDLDAPVGDWLPALNDLRLPSGARPQRAPTVRDLMRHTSGLAYPWETADAGLRTALLQDRCLAAMPAVASADVLQHLAALPLVGEPGAAFRYGYSTDVLGCIVEHIERRPLADCLQQRVFAPLAMRDTSFERPASDAGAPAAHATDTGWHTMIPPIGRRQAGQPWMDSGGAGLVSTLGDYAAFARLLAQGGRLGSERLLSARLFAEMSRQQLPEGVDGPAAYCGPGFGFGLGLALRQDWGPSAMPCSAGEMTWSGISGTALFVQPREQWFALMFSSNMASRMMVRMEFRRAAGLS